MQQLPGSYELSSNDSAHTITITSIISTLNKLRIISIINGDEACYEYYLFGATTIPTKFLYMAHTSTLDVQTNDGTGTVIASDGTPVLTIDAALAIHSIETGEVSYTDNVLNISSTGKTFYIATYYYVTSRGQVYKFRGSKIINGKAGGTLFINTADSVALYSESDILSADIAGVYVTAAPPTVRTFGDGITLDMVFSSSEFYVRFELSGRFRLASSTQRETITTPITIGDGVLSYGDTNLMYVEVHIVGEADGYDTVTTSASDTVTIRPGSTIYYNHDTVEALISLDGDLTKIIDSLKAFQIQENSGQADTLSVNTAGAVSYHGVEILTLDNSTEVESIQEDDILHYQKGALKIAPLEKQVFYEEQNIHSLAYHNYDSVGISLGSFNPAIHTNGMLYIDGFGRALFVKNTKTQYVIDSFLANLEVS